jgi:hypothetical protein
MKTAFMSNDSRLFSWSRCLPLAFVLFLTLPAATWAEGVPDPSDSQPATDEAQDIQNETYEQLVNLNEDLIELRDQHNDAQLKYTRALYEVCKGVLQDKADAAQKAGDAQGAAAYQAQIVDLKALRDATWDTDLPTLEDRNKIEALKMEQAMALVDKKLANSDELSTKDLAIYTDCQNLLNQYKPLMDQIFELDKELIPVRNAEDWAGADKIYAQLKDVRKQMIKILLDTRNDLFQKVQHSLSDEPKNL